MDLKVKIRQARKQSSLSQQELSRAIGVSDKAISAYEVGRSTPPIKILQKISEITGKPLSYFVDNSEGHSQPDQIMAKLDAIHEEIKALRTLIEPK